MFAAIDAYFVWSSDDLTKVGEMSRKVQEKRCMWFGHVTRKEEDRAGKRTTAFEVQGTRKRGRPNQRSMDKSRRTCKRNAYDESSRVKELCGDDSAKTSTPHEVVYDAEEEV